MSKQLPPQPNLRHLKTQAKELVKGHRSASSEAAQRIRAFLPRLSNSSEEEILDADFSLQEAQHVIAREYGFENWSSLSTATAALNFEDLARLSDSAMQSLLREIDQTDLAWALNRASNDVKEKFLSNGSERVRTLVEEEMELQRSRSADEIEESQKRILQQAAQLVDATGTSILASLQEKPKRPSKAKKKGESGPRKQPTIPVLSQHSHEEICQLLVSFAEVARREGILALEEMTQVVEDDFVKEALQLTIDGVEPDLIKELLKTRKRTLLHHYEMRYRMIVEGLLCIRSGDHHRIVNRKLQAIYIPALDSSFSTTRYTRSEISVGKLKNKLQSTPFAQMDFGKIVEVITDMAVIARTEGIGSLAEIIEVIDEGLLKSALRLVMDDAKSDGVGKRLEEEMRILLQDHDTRYCMVIAGICAIQEGKEPTTIEEEVEKAAQV